MRVALVHEWLTTWAGSERVVAELAGMFPEAPICVLLHEPDVTRGTVLEGREIRTSALQRLPAAVRRRHRPLLPLLPRAVESLDLRGFDLVISSNHAVAKGVLTRADQLHICYCHTPMRYAWDLTHDHLDGIGGAMRGPKRLAAGALLHRLRQWDVLAANRVDVFVANSQTVARRIAKHYRRRASVVYPPVEVERFRVGVFKPDLSVSDRPDTAAERIRTIADAQVRLEEGASRREAWYLSLGRLVEYKRTDIAVRAFAKGGMERELVVAGDGPQRKALERLAGRHVRMVGRPDDEELHRLLQTCRALVFAADEDFGILPVEAMAAGCPVIALNRGGAAETVIDGVTGVLFNEQTPESVRDAVRRFEALDDVWDPAAMRRHAAQFSAARFRERMRAVIDGAWAEFREHGPPIDDE